MAAGFYKAELFKVGTGGILKRAIRHEFEDCEKISNPVVETSGGKAHRQEVDYIDGTRPNIVPYEYCGECIVRVVKERNNG